MERFAFYSTRIRNSRAFAIFKPLTQYTICNMAPSNSQSPCKLSSA
jgi:hypothetical protein